MVDGHGHPPPLHKSTFAVRVEAYAHLASVQNCSLTARLIRGAWTLAPPALFFVIGHVPPLLSNFERLFLDHGIGGLLGELLGLTGLGPISSALLVAIRRPAPKRIGSG